MGSGMCWPCFHMSWWLIVARLRGESGERRGWSKISCNRMSDDRFDFVWHFWVDPKARWSIWGYFKHVFDSSQRRACPPSTNEFLSHPAIFQFLNIRLGLSVLGSRGIIQDQIYLQMHLPSFSIQQLRTFRNWNRHAPNKKADLSRSYRAPFGIL